MRILGLFLVFFAMACAQVSAGTDEGLYAPKAPEGSAFIRFVNSDEEAVGVKANGKSYGSVSAMQASSYYVFPEGDIKFSLGEYQAKETVMAGSYYTVTAVGVTKDTANTDRTKATLALYNLQDGGAVSLKAKSGTVTVLENIESGQSTARDINPIKIDLSIEKENGEKLNVDPFIMERGNYYSVFYNGAEAFVVTASVDTTR